MNHKPTDSMKKAAQRGLDLRKEYGRGGTAVGIARARDIVEEGLPTEINNQIPHWFNQLTDRGFEIFTPSHEDNPILYGWTDLGKHYLKNLHLPIT
jgi:hypothetical protein